MGICEGGLNWEQLEEKDEAQLVHTGNLTVLLPWLHFVFPSLTPDPKE